MDLTASKNPNSMVLASAKIELSKEKIDVDKVKKTWSLKDLEDLGLARGIKISFSASKIDVKADNGTVPLKGQTDVKAKVEFSLLERHLPLLGKVMHGLVTVTTVPAEKRKETDTKAANTAQKDKHYDFVYTNHDGAKPESIVIKQGSKTLVVTTDYTVEQGSGGMWGYTFTAGGQFDVAKAVTVEYEVARLKSYSLGKGSGGVVQPISMRLTNKRKTEDGRTISRTFEFPYGFYDAEDSITLKSKNDTDNVAEVPMAFEFSPHPDLVLDPELEAFSLYREGQEV